MKFDNCFHPFQSHAGEGRDVAGSLDARPAQERRQGPHEHHHAAKVSPCQIRHSD